MIQSIEDTVPNNDALIVTLMGRHDSRTDIETISAKSPELHFFDESVLHAVETYQMLKFREA
jgi:hypothetical protein